MVRGMGREEVPTGVRRLLGVRPAVVGGGRRPVGGGRGGEGFEEEAAGSGGALERPPAAAAAAVARMARGMGQIQTRAGGRAPPPPLPRAAGPSADLLSCSTGRGQMPLPFLTSAVGGLEIAAIRLKAFVAQRRRPCECSDSREGRR